MAARRDRTSRDKLVRAAPFVVGGAAIAVGLALGLRCSEDPPPTQNTSEVHEGGAAPYVPDLSGPDLGTAIAPGVALVSGVGVVQNRLVWLTTEGAALYAMPVDKGKATGKPSLVYDADGEGFGGALAADSKQVCWAELGREPAVVSCLAYARLVARGEPETIAEGGSPDQLTLDGGTLYWSDRGRIFGWAPGDEAPRAIASDNQRIAALAAAGGTLRWLELPYTEGARGKHRVRAWDGRNAKVLATLAEARERRHLWTDGKDVGWAEEVDDGVWVLRALEGSRTMAPAGEVTDLETRDGSLWWAEAHDAEGGVVTLLRRLKIAGGQAERLGRATGPVGALAVHAGTLYWSDGRGLVSWTP